MTEKKVDLDLRRKVAELDDWTDIRTRVLFKSPFDSFPTLRGQKSAGEVASEDYWDIPAYEMSFDAISEACDRHGIKFSLSMFEDCYQVKSTSVNQEKLKTEKKREVMRWSFTGETRAIALCNLFIAVMEGRLEQNRRAAERDHLDRKIAEDTLKLASQHPDFKRVCPDLDLRQKVATFVGWTDFYRGDAQQGLWGVPPLGASTTNTEVPHYETNAVPIIGALISSNIKYEKSTLYDHIEIQNKNFVYVDLDTGITACGETPEIALCYLFVAVMEARAAEKNFNLKPQEAATQEELVKIETPFTRILLQQIREKARECWWTHTGYTWVAAYNDLVIAADRLDAMLAREEWVKTEYGGEEKE